MSQAARASRPPRNPKAVQRLIGQAQAELGAGRRERARASLRLILDALPEHPLAHYVLGTLAREDDDRPQAVRHHAVALKGAPHEPVYWLGLVSTLVAYGRYDDARGVVQRFQDQPFAPEVAQDTRRQLVERLFAAAAAEYRAGALKSAERLLDLVIALDETHHAAAHMAGVVAVSSNRVDLGIELIKIALLHAPTNALYFTALGSAFALCGNHAAAIEAIEKGIEHDPSCAVAHANIAGVYHRCFRHGLALAAAERAVALDPTLAGAHSNRGSSLLGLGRLREAIEAFDAAAALDGVKLFTWSNRLFAKLYAAHVPPEEYYADAVAFGERFADPLLRRRPFPHDRDPDRRLRVGFVSADLCSHPVERFFEPFLARLDRERFEPVAFMTQSREDATSERLKTLFAGWHNISGLDDEEAADLVEAERIDILADLSGHSAGNRLMLFARKPAPVQFTWIGHPGSTGLKAMDYRLSDRNTDPPDAERFDVEEVWRMPRVSGTYQPPSDAPPVSPRAPFEESGYLTFGCFNRITKIGDNVLATWSHILARIPDARLMLVVGDVESPDIRAGVEDRLTAVGLPLDRVVLQPRLHQGYLALYHRVDVALDPFPYNGGTTSYDTLLMGVPLVTLRGRHAAARSGVTLLTGIGYEDLIADDAEHYVALAAQLDGDRDRLLALRRGLRERFLASPHVDHAAAVRDVEAALRGMWERWALASQDAGTDARATARN
jgi:protein O-GlcNAc transferase